MNSYTFILLLDGADKLMLETEVTEIDYSGEHVVVKTDKGDFTGEPL